LLTLGHLHESLLGLVVLLLVSVVEVDAALKHGDELIWWVEIELP
jgi:hypothetical protein